MTLHFGAKEVENKYVFTKKKHSTLSLDNCISVYMYSYVFLVAHTVLWDL